ncbi:MAG TPA: BTAD domain-containing putative transcriptional regulator, partial [Dehalococcoidia bacterium]|nr:BTAD domain-containing putative transcriptional regulator [Dehalococcoidia bacterium]
ASCRKAVSRLRQSLPAESRDYLVADSQNLCLRPEGVAIDVVAFERFAAGGTPETLERALALYAGPFLEGFQDCGEEFENWLLIERRRLEELFRQSLHRLLDHYMATGGIDRGIQVALRLLAVDPLQEGVHRTLMRLYMYQDRLGSALDQYNRCRELLASELGATPSAETERLRKELATITPAGIEGLHPNEDDLPERGRIVEAVSIGRQRRRNYASGRPSIVVMPFSDSGDERHQLGTGIADDIAVELGRFRSVDVIAALSAIGYAGSATPEQAAAELGADFVLSGSLRLRGERVRLTVRLVETASGRQVWSEVYDCEIAEMFDTQERIVHRAVVSLLGGLEGAELEAARRKRPEEWEAYDLWLQGSSAMRRTDLAGMREARRFFEQAIAKDPHFARAYVGLAIARLNEWACFSWNHWGFLQEEALELAQRAVDLDDRDHRGHCMLGVAKIFGGDYDGAQRQLMRALELNPNDSDVLAHASVCMALLGDHEIAVETGRRALYLAPHRPEWYVGLIGNSLFTARNYQEALEIMLQAPQALCDTPAFLAASYAQLGQAKDCQPYLEVMSRHQRVQLGRGWFPEETSCIDWVLGMNPYRRPEDVEHLVGALRKAGFE